MLSDLQQSSISCTFAVYGSYNHAQSVVHRLVRELIADCFGPTFKTHVRFFMNIGHVVENATILPCSSFTWRNCGFVRVACMDVACEQVFFFLFGGGGSREKPRKRGRKCKGRGKRGRIFFLAQYRSSQFILAPWF